ncbi:MAG: complex I subunit 5 family protein [Candidatus Omnitrophota bacterium]
MIRNLFPYPLFRIDQLSGYCALAVGLFFILTAIYSFRFMRGKKGIAQYYLYIILVAISSVLVILSNDFVMLLVFWGFLGLLLYLLINMGNANAGRAAQKSLIIVGGSDALMLLGIAIIFYFSGTFQMDLIKLQLNGGLLVLAYICIALACFAKAGVMPLHSWIPDCAANAPLPVTAYLPASLDKILGIYLLARITLNIFVMNNAMNIFLMCMGAFTIMAAVMMALVQHNLKKLLGYHAVSQVGYMVLGIATGNPVGIAGGLFHMLNNAIYKSCLFLTAGNVEYRTGTTELDKLGGLGKSMPVTYISCLIASLSISGVPPFNGFVSKWLIYQGLILNISDSPNKLQSIFGTFCLVAAMFGSALTLASFLKLLHAVFLGARLNYEKQIKEVPFSMWLPCLLLAATCVIFGVFAFLVPLKYFIFPAVASIYGPVNISNLIGAWSPVLVTLIMVIGFLLGFILFRVMRLNTTLRRDGAFVGGEAIQKEESMPSGTDFYNTIKETGPLQYIYKKAEAKTFDIYEQAKKLSVISRPFQSLHNGVLPTYLVWILLGMVGLFFMFVR